MALTKISRGLLDTGVSDSSDATAITIDSSENIGIGTSSPQGNLHVEGAAGASGGGIIYVTDADNGSTASDALHISKSGDTAFIYNRESSGDLQLGAGNTAGHVVIKSSGNVGIGTTSPSTFSGFKTLHFKNDSGDTIFLNESDGGVIGQIRNSDSGSIVAMGARSNHSLIFTTNDTERMRTDTSGRVLLGHSSSIANDSLDNLEVGTGSGNNGMTIYSGSSNYGGIAFADGNTGASDQYPGLLEYYHNDNSMRLYTGSSERMRIDSSGEIHVNTTATINSGQFEVLAQANHQAIVAKVQTNANSVFQGFDSSGSAVFVATGAGNLTITGTLSQGSDISLKENIKPLNNQLETVKKLNPVTFDWKEDKKPYQQIGFIAQEVEKHLPELIENKDDIKRMSYGNMTAVLVKAIQEQQELIETLTARIETLEGGE